MTMKNILYPLLGVVVFSLLIGCSGEKRPEGMPKLYPCSITVLQEGKPLENASIDLIMKNGSFKWPVSGTTDSSGVAELRTHGLYPGAPSGTFTVTIEKREPESDPRPILDPVMGSNPKPIKIFSFVDQKYTDPKTTPLEITIEQKSLKKEFDLGKPIRKHVDTLGEI